MLLNAWIEFQDVINWCSWASTRSPFQVVKIDSEKHLPTHDHQSQLKHVQGEAIRSSVGLEQTKYFTQVYDDVLPVNDHKPLCKLIVGRSLDEIENPPHVFFTLKEKTVRWQFRIAYVPGKETRPRSLQSMPAVVKQTGIHNTFERSHRVLVTYYAVSLHRQWRLTTRPRTLQTTQMHQIHINTNDFTTSQPCDRPTTVQIECTTTHPEHISVEESPQTGPDIPHLHPSRSVRHPTHVYDPSSGNYDLPSTSLYVMLSK